MYVLIHLYRQACLETFVKKQMPIMLISRICSPDDPMTHESVSMVAAENIVTITLDTHLGWVSALYSAPAHIGLE